MGCIDSVDIEFVIGFGIPQVLSLLECGGKIGASLSHSGKNIVGSPINNPVQAEELICNKAFAKSFENRNASGDACLKVDGGG